MNLKELFKKTKTRNTAGDENVKPEVPNGLFVKCEKCGSTISKEDLEDDLSVCPKCNFHMPISAKKRIEIITDKNSFLEWEFQIETKNVLDSSGYDEKLEMMREKTDLYEAVISGSADIDDRKVAIVVMDSRFMMASMGYYVGEQITRTIEKATEERLPVVIFTASGGARMQEGIVSLMQMAKTSAALKRHHDKGLLYITVLTHPTTGGVTASFASLGDIILSEPGALIGFAGQRVIESTIKQKLPEGFQSAEFQLRNGFVDSIVERKELRDEIGKILGLHVRAKPNKIYSKIHRDKAVNKKIKQKNTPWEIVNLARDKNKPVATEYISKIFDDFIEFHGDRYFGDDSAIVGGIAKFKGKPVTVIGQAKGIDTATNVYRNFGMPSPHGYRKSLRLMKQAEKFGRPIICFVDTPGAYCGITAEEGGQGEAIARNLFEMSGLTVPILTIIIGEAGSGGALAMAVSNEVWMMENSMYAILSPEGYASILWKDGSRASEAAEEMRLTPKDLMELGIIDDVIKEPSNYKREKIKVVAKVMEKKLLGFLMDYESYSRDEIRKDRYERFSNM